MLRILAALFCAIGALSTPALAVTHYVYNYTGPAYSAFDGDPIHVGTWFNDEMRVTGSIELSSQIAASTSIMVATWTYDAFGRFTYSAYTTFVAATLSNGLDTFTLVDAPDGSFLPVIPSPTVASYFSLSLVTDALGEIAQWLLSAGTGGRYVLPYGDVLSTAAHDQGNHWYGPDWAGASTTVSGLWAMSTVERPNPIPTIPLPGPAWFLMSGLAVLFVLRRLRRHPDVTLARG